MWCRRIVRLEEITRRSVHEWNDQLVPIDREDVAKVTAALEFHAHARPKIERRVAPHETPAADQPRGGGIAELGRGHAEGVGAGDEELDELADMLPSSMVPVERITLQLRSRKMAEVLVEFDAAFPGPGGARYAPRACARMAEDGRWEGWIEFSDVETGAVIRSARETTQPSRDDVMYWATGLTRVYLEGALDRALTPDRRPEPRLQVEPAFDGPAPTTHVADRAPIARPVLDPFEVYVQGERVLRQELSALDIDHLRGIIRAHGLDGGVAAVSPLASVLVEYIVAEVRARALGTDTADWPASPKSPDQPL